MGTLEPYGTKKQDTSDFGYTDNSYGGIGLTGKGISHNLSGLIHQV